MEQIKDRNSNLELLRIIMMVLIIASHYVSGSGLRDLDLFFAQPISLKTSYLIVFGAFGKISINCFVFITGYFMCKSKISLRKFLKLFLEYEFYSVIIYFIFVLTRYTNFSAIDFFKTIFPFYSISTNFTSCYLLFFLIIPFLNILVNKMNEKQHIYLIIWCIFVYAVIGTIPNGISKNYISWFICIYFAASYIRLYPKKIFGNLKFWRLFSIVSVLIVILSVLVCSSQYFVNIGNFVAKASNYKMQGATYAYAFIPDANALLCFCTGGGYLCILKI